MLTLRNGRTFVSLCCSPSALLEADRLHLRLALSLVDKGTLAAAPPMACSKAAGGTLFPKPRRASLLSRSRPFSSACAPG